MARVILFTVLFGYFFESYCQDLNRFLIDTEINRIGNFYYGTFKELKKSKGIKKDLKLKYPRRKPGDDYDEAFYAIFGTFIEEFEDYAGIEDGESPDVEAEWIIYHDNQGQINGFFYKSKSTRKITTDYMNKVFEFIGTGNYTRVSGYGQYMYRIYIDGKSDSG
ncbi:MAG: hypothetical protein RLO17_18755 [Cyclobacteriaceae bacterium]